MTVSRPTAADVDSAATHFGLTLDESSRDEFVEILDATLGSYDVVAELYDAHAAPTGAERAHITPTDNRLGAWYTMTHIADDTATGPLSGRRVAIKDNVSVAGIPMMNGSRTLEGFVATRDATVVTRLIDAGATIAGKSVCEDLCFSGSSFTSATGPVRNPWDLTREAGGSSGGSAALVAAGDVDLAIGGDQGGSVRIPSAFCGVVGHKPTFGLVPYTGAFPIERTIDHLGPIARTVTDAAVMLGVIAGTDGQDPRQGSPQPSVDYASLLDASPADLRVAVVGEGFGHDNSEVGVDETVRGAARALAEAGATVDDVSIPWHLDAFHVWNVIATDGGAYQMLDGNGYGLNADGLYDPEQMEYFNLHRRRRADELSETVKLVALCGHHGVTQLGGSAYARARNLLPALTAAYDSVLADYDVLLMPTIPYTASQLPGADISRRDHLATALGMVANTAPFNITGHPALSVPAGLHGGLPVGMMLVGKHHDDISVLRTGHAFEALVGGFPTPNQHSQV